MTYSTASFALSGATASSASTISLYPSNTLQVNYPTGMSAATGYNVYAGAAAGTETLQNASPVSLTPTPTNWNDGGSLTTIGQQPPVNEVGDGNLTEVDKPVDGTASHDQVALMQYDSRDRLIATKQGALMSGVVPDPAGETDSAHRLITFQNLDNLGETIGTFTYAGDAVSLGDFNSWSLSGTDASDLRTDVVSNYDDQGRVYSTVVSSVDQSSGTVGASLTANNYFDHFGNEAAQSNPGGQWTKHLFDGANRDIQDSTTDGGAFKNGGAAYTDWAHAMTDSNDIVLEQTDTTLDADGNATVVLDRQRFDNDPATSSSGQGDLTGPNGSSATASRDSYTVNWFDAADRMADSANLGTNGGQAYTLQTLPPARDAFSQATATGSTTTLVDTGRAETSGYFTGYTIAITAGTDAGQASTVTGYNASTGTLTFSPALTSATTSSSVYTLVPGLISGTSSATGSTTTLVDTSLSQPTGEFVGWALTLTSGTYSGSILTVTGYNASSGTLTFAPALAGSVASGVTFTLAQPALLAHTDYNSDGQVQDVIDPRGIITYNSYNLVGQTTSVIAAYTNGTVTASTNQTTNFTYDANGDQLTQTAVESTGNNQVTKYDYGTTGTIGTNLIDNDLLAETQLPDPTAGTASTIAPGTAHSGESLYTYNIQAQKTGFTDQDGDVHQYTIDPLGRVTADAVTTLGSGVDGTVRRLVYVYTDAGLMYQDTSYSAASGGSVVNQEQDAYNGLQQLVKQYQAVSGSVNTSSTPYVGYNYNLMADGENNSKLRSVVYPNGRILDTDYSTNQEPVTGITATPTPTPTPTPTGTATVTTASAHGLSTGATVVIEGAAQAALDGAFTITVTSSTTFTYTYTGAASSDSSSDITETPVSLDSTISRPDGLQDHGGSAAGTVLQSYTYLGLSTIVQETNGNNTELTYIQQSPAPTPTPTTIDSGGDRYTGLDRFGRVDYQNWLATSTGAQIQGDQYGYDADNNVLFDSIVGLGTTAAKWSQLYHASSAASGDNNTAYDPLSRVTQDIRGTLSASGNNTYSSAPLDQITNANINTVAGSDQTYTLDALGDWTSSAAGAGTGTSTAPTLTSTSRTNNSQNELTAVGSNSLTFDNNGNTTKDQNGTTYTYDAWDRPMSDSINSTSYRYLPGSDRAIKTTCGCSGQAVDSYYTVNMQVIEDYVSTGTAHIQDQYVWGLAYVNQMVERDDNSSSGSLGISGSGLGVRIYPLQDANYDVRALTNTSGSALQYFVYDAYGNATVLNTSYGTTGISFGNDSHSWIYGFQGGRYDINTGLYRFGARDYSPVLGRWMEQDPDLYVNGANTYQAEESDPASSLDPSGDLIVGKCEIDAYLKANGVTHYSKTQLGLHRDWWLYSGAANYSKGILDSEILGTMVTSGQVFTVTDGTVANLKKHVLAREDVIKFASKKSYGFSPVQAMDPNYWYPGSADKDPVMKSGVSYYDALNDIVENPSQYPYQLGCHNASLLTMMGGIAWAMGRTAFDQAAATTGVGGFIKDDRRPDFIPGDWGFIKNTGTNSPAAGYEGENIIYVGGGLYWGHTEARNTYRTLSQWEALVASWSGVGAHGATLDSIKSRPRTGLDT